MGKVGRKSRGERQYIGAKVPIEMVHRIDELRGEISRTDYLWSTLARHLGMDDLDPLHGIHGHDGTEQLALDQIDDSGRKAA